jgi:hypothetical protein
MPRGYHPFDNPMDDKRRKLHPDKHEEIIRKYDGGHGQSMRSLAKEYGVSRKLISIIVNPDVAQAVKDRLKEHWKDYHDREKLTEATRNLRRRKAEMGLSYPVKDKRNRKRKKE